MEILTPPFPPTNRYTCANMFSCSIWFTNVFARHIQWHVWSAIFWHLESCKNPEPFQSVFSRVIGFSSYCLHSRTLKRNGMQHFPRLPPDVLFVLWEVAILLDSKLIACSNAVALASDGMIAGWPAFKGAGSTHPSTGGWLVTPEASLHACRLAHSGPMPTKSWPPIQFAWEESVTHLSHCQSESSDPTHIVCCSEGHEHMMDRGPRLTPGSGARVLWSRRPQV